MKRRALLAAGALAGAALAGWLLRPGGTTRDVEPVRPGLRLPEPTPGEKAAFHFELFRSGAQAELGARVIPVWRVVGERALLALGQPALDHVLAPARGEVYRQSPETLVNVLRILPDLPGAGGDPRLLPFLLHWLDPANCPATTAGADWVSDFRLWVFVALQRYPREAAAPACIDELARTERVHDLRKVAMDILLRTHRGEALLELYDRLPPHAGEPEGDHRAHLMVLLHGLADPGGSAEDRAHVQALEPLLRRGARSTDPGERINALAALARLGRPQAADELARIFEQGEAGGDEIVAWSALDLLARDGPSDFVRHACEEKLKGPGAFTQGAGRGTALRLLARWWGDDPEVLDLLWKHLEGEHRVEPLLLLPRLARTDRDRTVRFLEAELASGDLTKRIPDALRLISGHPLPEAGPAVFDLARRVAPEHRPPLYAVLGSLRTAGTEALLLGELRGDPHPSVREAAVGELLNLAGEAGLAHLQALLERGDPVVLEALLQRALAAGAAGVPDALLPPLLDVLRRAPGEETRRTALLVLRFRGTLSGVGDGLREAYRTEPGRALSREIRAVLLELAHR